MAKTMLKDAGEFCRVFGDTPRNKILEYFLAMRELDFSIADVARETGLNRATTYNAAEELIKQKVLVSTRRIGITRLYKLNSEKPEVQALIQAFDVVLKKLYERYAGKKIAVIH